MLDLKEKILLSEFLYSGNQNSNLCVGQGMAAARVTAGGGARAVLAAVLCMCMGMSGAFVLPSIPALSSRVGPRRPMSLRMSADFDPLGIQQPPAGQQPPGNPQQMPPPAKMSPMQEKMIKNIIEKSKGSTKTKRVEFKTNAKTTAKVNDTDLGSNATLNTYMTLPADEWITLDDEYIERLDGGNGVTDFGYRFTVPLKKIMQVDLTATCDVFVKIDEGKKQLRFEAKGARILAGDDEGEEGRMVQVMGPNGTFVPQPLPANFSKSIQQSDMQLNFVTFVDWKEKGEAMWDVKETQIDMKTEVKVGMTFPPPLSFLPGFMLRQAGGLILKAASAALLPRFAQLLVQDYRMWATGQPRLGGSLFATPTDPSQMSDLKSAYDASGANPPVYTPPPATGVAADKE